jgi:hypothetical protein
MRNVRALKVFLSIVLFISFSNSHAQNFSADTTIKSSFTDSALNIYHRTLYPETGLYNGSEYGYNVYYPFIINEGDPFYISKNFSDGSVFYNNVLYKNVPLLFDIIKEELLIRDPGKIYIIRLNSENIKQFNIWGQTFIRISPDSGTNAALHAGFYDELYKGNVSLYKKVLKKFKENAASAQGLNKYVVERDEYFIKKDNQYFRIKNKKSLLLVTNNKKKEIEQFIKKNKLNLRKHPDESFTKVVAYYDGINN